MLSKQFDDFSENPKCTSYETLSKFKDFYNNFKDQVPSCFDRELLLGHFTASGLVVKKDKGDLLTLLMLHSKLNIWIQPGGHSDGNRDLLCVAKQEVYEETGLSCRPLIAGAIVDLDINVIPEYFGSPSHLHYDVRYVFTPLDEISFVRNEESRDLKWFNVLDILDNKEFDESLRKLVTAATSLDLSLP